MNTCLGGKRCRCRDNVHGGEPAKPSPLVDPASCACQHAHIMVHVMDRHSSHHQRLLCWSKVHSHTEVGLDIGTGAAAELSPTTEASIFRYWSVMKEMTCSDTC